MDHRSRILDAALRVFAETGYRGATTRRIAQEADVNEVTLFRHFGSKEELIRSALHHVGEGAQPVLPANPADPRRELVAWARAHHENLHARRAMLRTCMSECAQHPDMADCVRAGPEQVLAELTRYFEKLRADGWIDRRSNLRVAATVLMSALFLDATSRDVMPEVFSYAGRDAAAHYVDLILRSVGAASGNVESRG